SGTKIVDIKAVLSAGCAHQPPLGRRPPLAVGYHAVGRERHDAESGSRCRDAVGRDHPVVAVAEGEGANDPADAARPHDGQELGAPERQAAREPARRGWSEDLHLRGKQERGLGDDRRGRHVREGDRPAHEDGLPGDGDGTGTRDAVREPVAHDVGRLCRGDARRLQGRQQHGGGGAEAAVARSLRPGAPLGAFILGGVAVVRVGICSWADEGLLKHWYPREVRTAEARLRYYAERYDTVEVDSPFYRLPEPETAARWAERTPA